MSLPLSELTEKMLQAAKAAGADAADAIAVDGTSLNIEVRGGVLEQAERSESIDLGLRVFLGQRSDTRQPDAVDAKGCERQRCR